VETLPPTPDREADDRPIVVGALAERARNVHRWPRGKTLAEARAWLDVTEVAEQEHGPRLKFKTVEELRALPSAKVEWIVEGLLARGELTLLAAAAEALRRGAGLLVVDTWARYTRYDHDGEKDRAQPRPPCSRYSPPRRKGSAS
jgi:hypothetical protein